MYWGVDHHCFKRFSSTDGRTDWWSQPVVAVGFEFHTCTHNPVQFIPVQTEEEEEEEEVNGPLRSREYEMWTATVGRGGEGEKMNWGLKTRMES